jgi:DNA topoisomerase-3
MSTGKREQVQSQFLAGGLEVMVATIAFGMGVDKPDIRTVVHTSLPGTLEGFSQEIGRAGRDGKPSRAVLLHSWNDRKTHEFFHDKSYPDPELLERVFRGLGSDPVSPDALARRLRIDGETVETALDKLWIHGGARLKTEGGQQLVVRGQDTWRAPYLRQREHRREQLDDMQRYADGHACRMAALVRHFGDQEDKGRACGTCDVCAPAARACSISPGRRASRRRCCRWAGTSCRATSTASAPPSAPVPSNTSTSRTATRWTRFSSTPGSATAPSASARPIRW